MEIILREPKPGDIGWVISMHGIIYSRQFHLDSRFEIDIAKKMLSFYENLNDFNLLLIAQRNHERVGSVAVSMKSENSAFVNFLLVLDPYRGHGIGGRLMDHIIKRSRDHGLEFLRLETYSLLEDARNLYLKYGFKRYQTNKDMKKYGQVFDQEFWELRL